MSVVWRLTMAVVESDATWLGLSEVMIEGISTHSESTSVTRTHDLLSCGPVARMPVQTPTFRDIHIDRLIVSNDWPCRRTIVAAVARAAARNARKIGLLRWLTVNEW